MRISWTSPEECAAIRLLGGLSPKADGPCERPFRPLERSGMGYWLFDERSGRVIIPMPEDVSATRMDYFRHFVVMDFV